MKKSFQAEMDGTQQAISQIVCWCTTIALHQEFGVGKIRLDRITDRMNGRAEHLGHYDPGCQRQTVQAKG